MKKDTFTNEFIKKNKKKTETAKVNLFFPVYIGIMLLITYFINYLVNTAYTWNSKLQRVMSNFEYVLSFKTNRHAFLFALNLPDNVQNKKSLFKIALYMNFVKPMYYHKSDKKKMK